MRTAMMMVFAVATALPAAAQESARTVTVRKLESLRISVSFQDATLGDAVDYLREVTGLNFLIHGEDVDSEMTLTLKVKNLSVKSVLKLMLHSRDLTASWREGAIVIEPRTAGNEGVTLELYDVRSFLMRLRDFEGPKVELVSPSGNGPLVGAQFTLDEPEAMIEEGFLVDMIRENTGGQSWNDNSNAAIELVNGRLVINQTPKVHREISRFLQLLGQYR